MTPILQALVLAEHVYTDTTGKRIICGTFNQIRFTIKPLVMDVPAPGGGTMKMVPGGMQGGSPYAYLSLTDVCDRTELTLQFMNLTRNERIFGNKIAINSPDRLATIELVLPLPHLGIHEAGTYAFEVICDGEILGSYRITASEFHLTPPEQKE